MSELSLEQALPLEREAVTPSWRDKIRALAPNVGSASLAKRLTRPESYRQAAAILRDIPRWHRINSRLADYAERNGGFFFVQIGANDGIGTDPVRQNVLNHGWQGILVEPLPHVFKALKANYARQTGLEFANVAIAESEGTATMFAGIELPDGQPNPLGPMSSFKAEVVQKHAWIVDDPSRYVAPTEVQTTTLPRLLERYNVNHVDGVFVDTEGYDKVVLDQLDLERYEPQFILYEHNNLSASDRADMADRFRDYGYSLTSLRHDTFAELG